jgi:hypothetical protein
LLALADLHDTTAVWCSRDTGRTWVRELVLPGGTEVAGNRATQAGGCGVYVGPGSWEPEGIGCSVVRCISTVGSAYWYAGTDSGVFHLDLTPGVKGEPESRPTTGGRPALLSSGLSGLSRPGLDVLFDPAGRRVTASRSGIYFARPASGVMRDVSSVYKVILVP